MGNNRERASGRGVHFRCGPARAAGAYNPVARRSHPPRAVRASNGDGTVSAQTGGCMRAALSLFVAQAVIAPLSVALPIAPVQVLQAQAPCQFVLGFAAVRQAVGPAIVGDCFADERFNPANGNAEQPTTGGLLVWRKADNWTAFTDGYRTWLNGPAGLQVRLNGDPPFPWEHDSASSPPPAPVPSSAQAAVDAVRRSVSATTGVSPDQLAIERVEARDWPDSSLGCPIPGSLYAQVIKPGYLIVASAGGRRQEFHTDTTGQRLVACAQS